METKIQGVVLGYAILNKQLVLFSHLSEGNDFIYKITKDEITGDYNCIILLQGDLGFQLNSYFETLPIYENENIQKIYWVDGINQPRFINIADEYISSAIGINKINFVPLMNLNETVNIVNRESAGGSFPAGTVQYVMTYYNLNGTQSKIFYSSPLFYTAFPDRGGAPNVITNNVFDISITNVDKSFDYIRIYSILRTIDNGTPVVKRVSDIKIGEGNIYNYVDNNLNGSVEDVSILLYIGGDYIIPKTIEHKDNVLFLGNYEFKQKPISSELKANIKNGAVFNDYKSKRIPTERLSGQYPYENQLKYSAQNISYLKYLEWYRFGVQFQDSSGVWSDAVWLMDKRMDRKPELNNSSTTVYDPFFSIDSNLVSELNAAGWVKMRPLIVYPKEEEREIIAQGIVCPTVYNVEDRYTNSPFAQSSWFARPNIPFDLSYTRYSIDDANVLMEPARNIIANEEYLRAFNYGVSFYPDDDGRPVSEQVTVPYLPNWEYRSPIRTTNPQFNGAKWVEFRHDCPIPDNRYENAEIQNITRPGYSYTIPSDEARPRYKKQGIFFNNTDDIPNWVSQNKQNYYVDQSILTFHSPDLEFQSTIINSDLSNMKFRIIGNAALTGTSTNVGIATDSMSQTEIYNAAVADIDTLTFGKIGNDVDINNASIYGFKGLVSMPYWLDRAAYAKELDTSLERIAPLTSFVVYPFNRDYSFTNQQVVNSEHLYSAEQFAKPKDKQILNLRFAGFNEYYEPNRIWSDTNSQYHNGVSDIEIFNSTENTGIKLFAPENSYLDDFVYYGNIDKVTANLNGYYSVYGDSVSNSRPDIPIEVTDEKFFYANYKWTEKPDGDEEIDGLAMSKKISSPIRLRYKSSPHAVVVLNYSIDNKQTVLPTHYHTNSQLERNGSYSSFANLTNNRYRAVNPVCFQAPNTKRFWEDNASIYNKHYTKLFTANFWGRQTPGAETSDNYEYRWVKNTTSVITSDGRSSTGSIWYNPETSSTRYSPTGRPNWRDESVNRTDLMTYSDEYSITRYFNRDSVSSFLPDISVNQDVLPIGHDYGYFWIAEIYNDNVVNRFGGTSDDALFQNQWVIAGPSVPLEGQLLYNRGDTYLQRYDHLKTFTADPDGENTITEIVSFFCETHINIDGRYDRNRGNINNLVITPELFNLFNPVYTQKDNLFTYHVIDATRYNLNIFSNSITWTKTKVFGEEIDSWTKINVVDNLDLDGNKGPLRTITKFNNELFAFQDEGIANILFNSRTQFPSTEFSNILIGNSGVVDGKYYIAQYGTANRGSVKSTPNGIYFIDGITNGIYLFNGQSIRCISDEFGFRDWVSQYVNNKEWSVINFDNFITHYDEASSEVYFTSKEFCLNFSEYLDQFSSFMSYEYTPHMFNIDGSFYSILHDNSESSLYEMETGEYNMYYKNISNTNTPKYEPYYITVVANNEPVFDKIFTNVDFKADYFDAETNEYLPHDTYDTLNIWTEYQSGETKLYDDIDLKSPLKKKFNRWRANIPRDKTHTRQRIRNNWAFVKLSKEEVNTLRSELHELLIYYYS